jgi:acid phosphatase
MFGRFHERSIRPPCVGVDERSMTRGEISDASSSSAPPAPQAPLVEPLERRQHLSAHARHHAIRPPRYDHVVVVFEENKSYGDILSRGRSGVMPSFLASAVMPSVQNSAPYIQWLAAHGANLTNAHGEAHPSQPNYIAFYSGSFHGVTNDTPPSPPLTATSLGGQLIANGLTFKSYAQGLPQLGSRADTSGNYARKHNPAASFADTPPADIVSFKQFPRHARDFKHLPTVSTVIPDQQHDMHSGSIRSGDDWLRKNLNKYAAWARTHNSLLVVTWDEGRGDNRIPTVLYGANVKRTASSQFVNHYSMLRTIEDVYGLTPLGNAATAAPVRNVFSVTAVK